MSYERVYTVDAYYDGPRGGIADYRGKPHVYDCQFSQETEDYTNLFWLMEIDRELAALAEEQYAIFLRWSGEYRLGKIPAESHPALPAERARYDELTHRIGDRLKVQPERSIVRRGRFTGSIAGGLQVRWTRP